MSNLGLGVMIGMLSGNKDSVEAFQSGIGKVIATLSHDDTSLFFTFTDGTAFRLYDDGQSCCENRYMRTDDNLEEFVGATLLGADCLDAPPEPDEYGDHEVQFLHVRTDRGTFTMSNHNEHNGYYGGFCIRCERQ